MRDDPDLDLIYDAAVDPSLWPLVLDRLIDRVHGSHGSLVLERADGGGDGLIARMDPAVLRQYLPQCHDTAPLRFSPATPAGHFLSDRQMAEREALVASRYYREFLRPVGINSLATAILWRGAEFKCCMNLTRSPRQAEFDAGDIGSVQDLGPHLARAMGVSLRLTGAAIGAEATIDRLSHGVLLLDQRGHPRYRNREADAILAAHDGLALTRRGLIGARRGETERLAHAIARAAPPSGEGSALRLERPSGRRPFVILVTPFRLEISWLGVAPPVVMVTVTDPERHSPPSEARLMQLYGLTRTQAAIGVQLLSGVELTEIAARRRISPRTARVHLSQIFAKTGARRQADLLRVLLADRAGFS